MRFGRLDLRAFGSFTDRQLELAAPGDAPALAVIYGDNEAGKSTALRAISALLYGFPAQSPDNHTHHYAKLRVGARLLFRSGESLEVVRRKGNKRTLLGADGEVLDEECLALRGIDDGLYRNMFGLDHEGLRRGARALLDEGSGVGETLFQASAGGASIAKLLRTLDEESSRLYRPRGSTRELNQALRRFKEARARVKDSALKVSEWEALNESRRETSAELETRETERFSVSASLQRLRNDLKLLPLITELKQLKGRYEEVADAPRLPVDAAEERSNATRARDEASAKIGVATEKISRKREALESLAEDSALTRIEADTIGRLEETKGAQRKAEQDLSRRQGELRGLEAEISRLVAKLHPAEPSGPPPPSLRVSAAAKGRIRALGQRYGGLEATHDERTRSAQRLERRLHAIRHQLETTPAPPDDRRLRDALARADRLGEAEDTLARLASERDETEREMDEAIARLEPWTGDPDALLRLRPPSPESVDDFAQSFARRRDDEKTRSERIAELERDLHANREALEQILEAGDVPSEDALIERRKRRDELWRPVQEVLEGRAAPDASARGRAFVAASAEADAVADRLWRDAARVQQVASRRAAEARLRAEVATLEARRREASAEHEADAGRWAALWAETMADPRAPTEMQGWLRRHAQAIDAVKRGRKAQAEHAKHDAALAAAREDLRAALDEVPAPPGASTGWDALVSRARAELEARQAARRRHEGLVSDAGQVEREQLEAEAAAQEAARAREAWAHDWEASVAPLELDRHALPEEAEAVLGLLEILDDHRAKAAALERRIETMARDREAFARQVRELADSCLPAAADASPLATADRLVGEYREAREQLKERRRLEAEIAELEAELLESRATKELAEQGLQRLQAAAGAESTPALIEAEDRAARRRQLESEIVALEQRIAQLGDGGSVEVLLMRAESFDSSAMQAEVIEREAELQKLDDDIKALNQRVGTLEAERKALRDRSSAEASERAQSELATIDELTRRYARSTLAGVVLRRQIERYREKHQGPILEAATALFPRLTLGAWSGLEIDYGREDKPELVCVRDGGDKVSIPGLSDGTLDSLFLALRVASLQEFAQHGEPLPVVLDDALIQFDDRRVAAALTVLGELAQQMQVLCFTHHRRIVELAEQALGPERVAIHEL